MKAVLLAAGYGKRIQPVSDFLPKPLLPIDGKPIIETTLTTLSQCGVQSVIIVVGYMSGMIRRYVGDGSRFGVSVTYVTQHHPNGTGHAVQLASDHIDDDFMVLAGDTAFSRFHIEGMMELFVRSDVGAALCLKKLSPERLALTSSVSIDEHGVIDDFVEKPPIGTAPSMYAAALLHVYVQEVKTLVFSLEQSPRGELELPDVLPILRQNGHKIVGKEFPLPPDLTTIDDLMRLNFSYIPSLIDAGENSAGSEFDG